MFVAICLAIKFNEDDGYFGLNSLIKIGLEEFEILECCILYNINYKLFVDKEYFLECIDYLDDKITNKKNSLDCSP